MFSDHSTHSPPPIPASPIFIAAAPRWHVWVVAFALCVVCVAAYHRTFSVPFLFDDIQSIPLNNSIRRLDTAFLPPNTSGETVSGRPLLNFSFAINYAIGGKNVRSYHVGNLLIHLAAGLALFGLIRRVLLLPGLRGRFGGESLWLAAAVAALWMLHPLQTESVTYIVQRAESLMALWYLLTMYCFVRAMDAKGKVAQAFLPVQNDATANGTGKNACATFWMAASVLSCLLGMVSKEVMVSAPVMVLLLDRAVVAGSFRAAWAQRKIYYCALAATWLALAWCVMQTGSRGGTAGLGADMPAWSYLLTQAKAIVHYLRLVVWPGGLVFDYGTGTVSGLGAVWPQSLLVVALVGVTGWLVARKPVAGLAPFFFFAVLAPSSSFIPIATQTMAEHRMYLPLAAAAAVFVFAVWILVGRGAARRRLALWGMGAIALALAVVTGFRNETYRTEESIWRDTVAKAPANPRAHSNLGKALTDAGLPEEALKHCRIALELKPAFFEALNNHGYALSKLDRYAEAIAYYDKALAAPTGSIEQVLCNRGHALMQLENPRYHEAIADFVAALRIRPDYVEALSNYGNALCSLNRLDEALAMLDKALRIDPAFAPAWNNRGNVFSRTSRDPAEAMRSYKRAYELDPKLWDACDNVARYSLFLGRPAEAVPYYLAAVAMRPDFVRGRHELALALLATGRPAESLEHFEAAIRLNPNLPEARHHYAAALAQLGRLDEAISEEAAALRLAPNFEQARAGMLDYMQRRQAK